MFLELGVYIVAGRSHMPTNSYFTFMHSNGSAVEWSHY